MITTHQIKSRFRRSHLIKLANDMLLKDLELKEGTVKWFVLKKGHTAEELADCVTFEGLSEKINKVDPQGRRWHTMNAVFTSKQINWRGTECIVNVKVEVVCDDDWRTDKRGRFLRHGWVNRIANAPYQYQLDQIIMWDLFRYCDHVIKDNSEIPVFI